MFDYNNIKQEVETALGEFVDDYDVDSIVQDLSYYTTEDGEMIRSIDDLDSDDFWSIVERNDISA